MFDPRLLSSIVQFILFFWSFAISKNILRIRKFHKFRPIYAKQAYVILTLFGSILVFSICCLVETQSNSILSLAFNASSFRVTEENLVFETV